jgi:hypothetical protein
MPFQVRLSGSHAPPHPSPQHPPTHTHTHTDISPLVMSFLPSCLRVSVLARKRCVSTCLCCWCWLDVGVCTCLFECAWVCLYVPASLCSLLQKTFARDGRRLLCPRRYPTSRDCCRSWSHRSCFGVIGLDSHLLRSCPVL